MRGILKNGKKIILSLVLALVMLLSAVLPGNFVSASTAEPYVTAMTEEPAETAPAETAGSDEPASAAETPAASEMPDETADAGMSEMPEETPTATATAEKPLATPSVTEAAESETPGAADAAVVEESETTAIKDYIRENIDTNYAEADRMVEADILLVKQTLVDGTALDGDLTIDSLWGSEKNVDAFLRMDEAYMYLYDTDEDSGYFVALADTMHGSSAAVTDYAFAYTNLRGEAVTDCIFDKKTGLAYVPKRYLEENKNGIGIMNIQLQLMQVYMTDKTTTEIGVSVDSEVKGKTAASGTVETDAMEYATDILLAEDEKALENVSGDSITVAVNDVPTDCFSYNEETGVLTVDYPAAVIETVDVEVGRESLPAKLKALLAPEEVHAASSDGSDWASSGLTFTFRYAPAAGDTFQVTDGRIDYNEGAQYTNASNSYGLVADGNSVIADVEKMYDVIKNNSSITGYHYQLLTNAGADLYFKAYLNSQSVGTAKGNSVSIPSVPGGIVMACAHVTSPFGTMDNGSHNGSVWSFKDQTVRFRIMSVHASSTTSGYMTIGLITPQFGTSRMSQSGAAFIRVGYKLKEGYLRVCKTTETDGTEDRATLLSYNKAMIGAQYGVYTSESDAKNDKNRVTTLTTYNPTGDPNTCYTEYAEVPFGTYYVKEIPGTEPDGYECDGKTYKATVSYANRAKNVAVTVTSEEPLEDGSLQVVKTGENGDYSLGLAVYGIYDNRTAAENADDSYVTTVRTNASGKSGKATVPAGTYWVRELIAPAGFKLDTEIHRATVTASATTTVPVTVTSNELPVPVKFKLSKVSSDPSITSGDSSYSFKNAEYALYRGASWAEAEELETYMTGADGTFTTGNLELSGSSSYYYIRERQASPGYGLDRTVYRIRTTHETPNTISSPNNPVSYKLWASKDGGKTWTESGSGSVSSGGTVTVTSTEPVKTWNLLLKKTVGKITITDCMLYDWHHIDLLLDPPAEYTLYYGPRLDSGTAKAGDLTDTSKYTKYGTYRIGEDYSFEVDDIPLKEGSYWYLVETKAPPGFLLDGNIYQISFDSTAGTYWYLGRITPDNKYETIDWNPLSGFPVIEVGSCDGEDPFLFRLQKESADKSLTEGNSAYSLAGAQYEVCLSKNGSLYMPNEIFYSADVYEIDSYYTNEDGSFALTDGYFAGRDEGYDTAAFSVLGKSWYYYIFEYDFHPVGYVLDLTVYRLQVWNENGTVKYTLCKTNESHTGYTEVTGSATLKSGEAITVTSKEPPKYICLSMQKRSEDTLLVSGCKSGYSLAGAEYTVYNPDGSVRGTYTTDENGKFTTGRLALQQAYTDSSQGMFNYALPYTIKETKPSPGYAKDPATYYVEVYDPDYDCTGSPSDRDRVSYRIQKTVDGKSTYLTGKEGGYSYERTESTWSGDTVEVNNYGEAFTSSEPPKYWDLKFRKESADKALTDRNGIYSLEGAEYTLYYGTSGSVSDASIFKGITDFTAGTSSTASSDPAKTAACDGFTLALGAVVGVTFEHGWSGTGTETLNVNGTGAFSIDEAAFHSSDDSETVYFKYNGRDWDIVYNEYSNDYTYVTDENGSASRLAEVEGLVAVGTSKLPVASGYYFLKETKPSPGYQLDTGYYRIRVSDVPGTDNLTYKAEKATQETDGTYSFSTVAQNTTGKGSPVTINLTSGAAKSYEPPKYWNLKLRKESADKALTDRNGSYSLEGAEYTLYYGSVSDENVFKGITDFAAGTSSTASSDTAKTAACDGFTLADGAVIRVTFEHGWSATTTGATPTLDVNGTGAFPIDNAADHSFGDDETVYFRYTRIGSYWDIVYNTDDYIYTTDENGYFMTNDLPVASGCYFLKETKPSPGYELDTGYYRIMVSDVPGTDNVTYKVQKAVRRDDGTYSLETLYENASGEASPVTVDLTTEDARSYEPPKHWNLKLRKESANKKLTDGNDCYSLEGAEYTLYYGTTDAISDAEVFKEAVEIASGTCDTIPPVDDKEADCDGFTLADGAVICVTTQWMWYSDATLNVNGTGAYPVYYDGAAYDSNAYGISDGDSVYLRFDGMHWNIVEASDVSGSVCRTDENGYFMTNDLPVASGCYFLKETKPSPGYELDTSYYRIRVSDVTGTDSVTYKVEKATLKADGTYSFSTLYQETAGEAAPVTLDLTTEDAKSCEPPKHWNLKLRKESANKKLTDGNACYSLEGAEYTLYYGTTDAISDADVYKQEVETASGTCDTIPPFDDKEATCDGFTLADGAVVCVTTQWMWYSDATLDVNGTGAYPVYYNGSAYDDGAYEIGSGDTVYFRFDGAHWNIIDESGIGSSVYTTDKDGCFMTDDLPVASGCYFLKETKPSPGYELDTSYYRIRVSDVEGTDNLTYKVEKLAQDSGKTLYENTSVEAAPVTVDLTAGDAKSYEQPANDPFALTLQKGDKETGEMVPQGIASLAGAIFELDYYDNTDGDTSGDAYNTWYFKTDEKGVLDCQNESYLVKIEPLNDGTIIRSDALYMNDAGKVIYPVGTYVIREIVSPTYYLLEGSMQLSGTTCVADVTEGITVIMKREYNEETGAYEVVFYQGDEATGERIINATNLSAEVYDDINRSGSVKVVKHDGNTDKPLAGVTFKLVGIQEGDEHVATTDENGEVFFDDLLPQDYTLTETETVEGRTLLAENVQISVPCAMTEDEIEEYGADINAATYDEAYDRYCFYNLTYEIGNSATFKMPMSGIPASAKIWIPFVCGMALLGCTAFIVFKRKRRA